MKLSSFGRARVVVAAAAGCGAAAAILAVGAGAATAAPAARPVVVVTCTGRTAVRPSSYVLTCADGNNYLTRLGWVHWSRVAFAVGTERINACFPTCAAGKFYSFPVLVNLWRAQPLRRHGLLYFSRMTLVRTGSLRLPHNPDLPRTETYVLSRSGGV
jgi:hypothetical protein